MFKENGRKHKWSNLSNVSIKAYRQECNSGIFLNEGRLLSNLENDFWNYDNIFELLDQFEFKDNDISFAKDINSKKEVEEILESFINKRQYFKEKQNCHIVNINN